MTNLHTLHNSFNQSPWLDNLSRELIRSGKLQQYIDNGIRGLTSNPTILERAITTSSLYDDQIKALSIQGLGNEEIFFNIVIDDIRAAAKLLEPIWNESQGEDGYVSLEVSPTLARDTAGTIAQAKRLWEQINIPNLMIKVPATIEGVPAIKELIASNINVNVTLIFGLDRYTQVVDAYRTAHEDSSNTARSVASFFVSRTDSEVDNRLNAIGTDEALNLRGQAAIAQSRIAYGIFLEKFVDIVSEIDTNKAGIQRLLWASTSTKDPDYDDLLYVTGLIAPLTVNTLPDVTIEQIIDHLPSSAASFNRADMQKAQQIFERISNVGVDLKDVSQKLESEGVDKFQASFTNLLAAIESKR